ncbi:MAG: tetratricopeptide repeat protein [Gammaproteobacteria bacterium]
MKFSRHYFIASLAFLAAGCSGLTGQQAAAPIYDPYHRPSKPAATVKPAIEKKAPPSQSAVTTPLKPAAPPEWATTVQKTQPEHLRPVVVALIADADHNTRSGNLDSAVATLERGLRIEPRNATLIYKLAEVRLKQSKPRLAEDLAKKSALLAGSDRLQKKRSWLLVAEARRMQGDTVGAREAELKAEGL